MSAGGRMRRRDLIALGGAAALWPLASRAQRAAPAVVGFLHSGSPGPFAHLVRAFREGLGSTGHVVGENVGIEFRWAMGHFDQLPGLAAELVRLRVAAIVAAGGANPALAAKNATATIPIIFTSGGDPVRLGFVASLAKPGGNVTGVNLFTAVLDGKRLQLVREVVPDGSLIAVLLNPNSPNAASQVKDVQDTAASIRQRIEIVRASTVEGVETAFAAMAKLRPAALLVCADPFFYDRRERIVALATRLAVPAIFEQREFAEAGGLMSYGTSLKNTYRQAGVYTGRVLDGEKPANLPVVQSTHFEFVINLKRAKSLGLTISEAILARADEVIE